MTSLALRRFRYVITGIIIAAVLINLAGLFILATRKAPLVNLRVSSVRVDMGRVLCRGTPLRYRYTLTSLESGVYQITRTLVHADDVGELHTYTGRTSFIVVPEKINLETVEVWISDPGGSYALYDDGSFILYIAVSGAGREFRPSVAFTSFAVAGVCES